MYEKNIKNYIYVCPHCFNKPEDCTCSILPESLIQLDKNIWPAVKVLNNKWYFTTDCCEGHTDSRNSIYIIFRSSYKFSKPVPKGFENKKGVLMADFSGGNEQTRKRKKRKLLNDLYEWACSLESRKPENFIM